MSILGISRRPSACQQRRVDVVRLLLSHHAKIDVTNRKGYQPLMIAADVGCVPIIRLLIGKGAGLHAKDPKEGSQPPSEGSKGRPNAALLHDAVMRAP